MSKNKIFRLQIQATESTFHPNKLETASDEHRICSDSTNSPVPSTVIGYWVDVIGSDCQVLFRKFLNNLPLDLPHTWPQWGKRKRQHAQYLIEVPAFSSAQWLNLYEQRIPAPGLHVPERQRHFQFPVEDGSC